MKGGADGWGGGGAKLTPGKTTLKTPSLLGLESTNTYGNENVYIFSHTILNILSSFISHKYIMLR